MTASLTTSLAFAAGEGSQGVTLDGTLYSDTSYTTPLLDAAAVINVKIYNPARDCILYEEQQVVNTTATAGRYNIKVGSNTGAGKRVGDDPNNAMIDVFQNTAAITAINGGCGGYTPTAGDDRYLRVTVTPSATGVPQTLVPDLTLTSVPNALVAESVQGLDRDKLAEFGTHINANMTPANLLTLFDGSDASALHNHDGRYAQLNNSGSMTMATQTTIGFGSYTNAQETTLTGGLGAGDEGKMWWNSETDTMMYWDGTTAQAVGTGAGGVTTVFGRSGAVTAATSDYDADQIDNTPAGDIAATDVQAAIDELDTEKLALAGGTMTGPIAMGTSKITGLGDGAAAQDAATMNNLSSAITANNASYVAKAGDSMTGALTMNAQNEIRFADDAGGDYISFKAPSGMSSNYDYTLPPNYGTNTHVLTTDGAGALTWTAKTTDTDTDTQNTLDGAYDEGGAGVGRAVTVDNGAIQFTGSNAADETLEVSNSGNGGAMLVENTGTGASLLVNDEAADTSPFMIDASGNVGIGNSSPAGKLQINSAGGETVAWGHAFNVASATAGGTPLTIARTDNPTNGQRVGGVQFGVGTPSVTTSISAGIDAVAAENWSGSNLGSELQFKTSTIGSASNTVRMTIDSDGSVGIGTAAPTSRLQVDGGITLSDTDMATAADCDAAGEAGRFRYSSGSMQFCNGSAWQTLGVSGSGLTSLNAQTGSTQTFANGAAGTQPDFVSGSDIHTLNIPLASGAGVTSGTISKTDYDAFAAKVDRAGDTMTGTLNMATENEVRFQDAAGGDYAGFKAAATTTSYTMTLPAGAAGADGDVLSSTTGGVLSWVTPTAGTVTSITTGNGLTGGAITSTGTIDIDLDTNPGLEFNAAKLRVDASDGVKLVAAGLEADIDGLTAETTPDGAADTVMIYDSSATALRKMTINNLTSLVGGNQNLAQVYDQGTNTVPVTDADGDVIWNLTENSDFHIQDAGGAAFTVIDDGSVGIGTATPQGPLHVFNADVSRAILATEGTDGTDQNTLLLLTKASSTTGAGDAAALGWHVIARGDAYSTTAQQNDLMFTYWDGTSYHNAMAIDSATRNIGIGTSTPESQLEISGGDAAIQLRGQGTVDYSSSIRFAQNNTTWRGGYIQYDGSANQMIIGVHNAGDELVASDIEAIAIDRADGKVGISTYLNYQPNGTECAANEVLKWDDTNDRWICGTDNTGGGSGTLDQAYDAGAATVTVDGTGGGDVVWNLTSTNVFKVQDGGTDAFVVDDSGNVGVGLTAPTSAFDMNGAFNMQEMAAPAVSAAGDGRIYFDSTAKKFRVSEDNGAYVDLVTAAGAPTTRDMIAGSGMTGGGTLAADRTFNVIGGDGIVANADDIAVDFTADKGLHFVSNKLEVEAGAGISLDANGVNVDVAGLTAETTPDGATDMVMIYDDSATALRKMTINNLTSLVGGNQTLAQVYDQGGNTVTVTDADNDVVWNLSETSDFIIQDNGTDVFIVDDTGTVGVGLVPVNTGTPSLQVSGTVSSQSGTSGIIATTTDWVATTTGSGVAMRTGANTGDTWSEIQAFDGGGATATDLVLNRTGGNVGIGDETPDHKLDVDGNIGMTAGSYLNFGDTSGSGGYGIRDNSGNIEVKNSSGNWAAISGSFGTGNSGFVGSIEYPADGDCLWSENSGSLVDFPADASCDAPTVYGAGIAPATRVPEVEIASLPAGRYQVAVSGLFDAETGTQCGFAIYDGSTHNGFVYASDESENNVMGYFQYATAQSNVRFRIQSVRLGGSNDCNMAGDMPTTINVIRVDGNTSAVMLADDDGDTSINSEASTDEDILRFTTAGTERMNIDASGNINVSGTFAPTGTVDLTGATLTDNAISVDDLDFASTNGINIPSSAGAPTGSTEGQLYYDTGTDTLYTYDGGGWNAVGGGSANTLDDAYDGGAATVTVDGTGGGDVVWNLTSTNVFKVQDSGTDAFVVDADGDVGVGLSSPIAELQVAGDSGTAAGDGIFRYDTDSGSNDVGLKMGAVAGAGSAGYSYIQSVHTGVANDANIALNPDGGFVGIGTDTPGGHLTVQRSSNGATDLQISALGTSNNQQANLSLVTLSNNSWLGQAANKGWTIGARGNAHSNATQQNDLRIHYWSGAGYTNVMHFDSVTGNVGYGTDTPAAKLHIEAGELQLTGAGAYFNYQPNNTECGNDETLKWDDTNDRWICGTAGVGDFLADGSVAMTGLLEVLTSTESGTNVQSIARDGGTSGFNFFANTVAYVDGSDQIWGGGEAYGNKGLIVSNGGFFGFRASGNILNGIQNADARWYHGGAGIISQRHSTNAQESRIYNTYDGTDDEYISMGFLNNANVFTFESEATGTGTARDFAFMSGNIGFGTTTPTSELDLNGALTVQEMAAPAVSAVGDGRIYFDSTSKTFKVSEDGGAYVDLVTAAGAPTTRDMIAGAGLTGGGTLAADRTFNVVGADGITVNADDIEVDINGLTAETTPDGAADTVMIYDDSASALRKMTINNLTSLVGGNQDLDSVYDQGGNTVDVDSDDVIWNLTSTNDFKVQDAGTDVLVVSNNGNVGIGIASPAVTLHSDGVIRSSDGAATSSRGKLELFDNSGVATIQGHPTGDGLIFSGTADGEANPEMVLLGGNVGVGDETPDHKLDVDGNIGMTAGGYLNFGDTTGSSGYGIRDNGGNIEIKNSTGAWSAVGGSFGTGNSGFVGSLRYAATSNCSWSSSSSSWANYSADSDCPTPSVQGAATAPATKIPGVTFTSLPAGRYMVTFQAYMVAGPSNNCYYAIHDGTNRSTPVPANASYADRFSTITAFFDYSTSQANITYQIQLLESGSGTCDVRANDTTTNRNLDINVIRIDGNGTAVQIADDDGDTAIYAEESSDEDILRFDTAGTERLVIDGSGNATFSGSVSAASFTGDGSGLDSIGSSAIADNSISVDDLNFASTNGVNIPQLASDPGSPTAGQMYYNTTSNKMMVYNGSSWTEVGAGGGGGGLLNIQVFNSSGTYTPTAGTETIKVVVTGGGGGGASSANNDDGGGGGGAGATAIAFMSTIAPSYTVTIGGGGGGGSGGGDGNDGGQSAFGIVTAEGGNGGFKPNYSSGGPAQTGTANATISIPGGGGHAGSTANTSSSGAGGASYWGGGGFGLVGPQDVVGQDGGAPGSGGGGGLRDASTRDGGDGADGIVVVYEYGGSGGSSLGDSEGVDVPTLASAPSSPDQGQMYYNTGDDKLYVWDGSAWQEVGSGASGGGSNTDVAFRAYANAATSIANTGFTKVNFAAEEYDTESYYNTGNSRFTPLVAGYYFIHSKVRIENSGDQKIIGVQIYKNGSLYSGRGCDTSGAPGQGFSCVASSIVYLNGSTDYVEIYSSQDGGSAKDTGFSSTSTTTFEGLLVSGATSGEVKFNNASSTCSGSTEGTQRYSSSTKRMEFCDGTNWRPVSSGVLQTVSTTNSTETTIPAAAGGLVVFSQAITPDYSFSKVNLRADIAVAIGAAGGENCYLNIVVKRGSTVIETKKQYYWSGSTSNTWRAEDIEVDILDSPNTTSAVTYSIELDRDNCTEHRKINDTTYGSGTSTMDLYEIAP